VLLAVFFVLGLPFGILYAATRPKGTSAKDRATKGCVFVAAFPLLITILILLIAVGSQFVSSISNR
jgi:hypothetical protein